MGFSIPLVPKQLFLQAVADHITPSLHNTNTIWQSHARQHWNRQAQESEGSKDSRGNLDALLCWWETWSVAISPMYLLVFFGGTTYNCMRRHINFYTWYTNMCVYKHMNVFMYMCAHVKTCLTCRMVLALGIAHEKPSTLWMLNQRVPPSAPSAAVKANLDRRLLVIWVGSECLSVGHKLILCLSHVHPVQLSPISVECIFNAN